MRFSTVLIISAAFTAFACSSSDDKKDSGVSTGGATGSGGKSAAGGKGTGGDGSGGAAAECAGYDAGSNFCHECLAAGCCEDTKACFADSSCSAVFASYQSCVHDAEGDANEVSDCFANFAISLQEAGTTWTPFTTCDYNCARECGGPLAL